MKRIEYTLNLLPEERDLIDRAAGAMPLSNYIRSLVPSLKPTGRTGPPRANVPRSSKKTPRNSYVRLKLSPSEHAALKRASRGGTLGNYLRRCLGLAPTFSGAPLKNKNRTGKRSAQNVHTH